MKTVSVSELKTHLSRYLREVRRGGEVQILDRGVPVARLSPLPAYPSGEDEEHRRRLVEAGVLRPGRGRVLDILDEDPLEVPGGLLGALAEDRQDRF